MSDSKYVPRDFCTDPSMFGRRGGRPQWREDLTSSTDLDQLAASQAQHRYAQQIRAFIKGRFRTVRNYSDMNELNYARISRMLRGEIVMTLVDVVAAERMLPGVFDLLKERVGRLGA
ncbi:hypothetical protein HD599_003249 [Conyzicola lurida]|uniref:Uncharacterized protein n=1 Tax=Conyzicola lurida TaxID=1172621 RepID=A0A841ATB7_9MICO|nr:hypothetical protein [Conyzicola lurida]MBB5844926.1 hypothetical protein [Conyzicola lurida]